jgi:pimeloyl-ACP methyl ester carboxylesterase
MDLACLTETLTSAAWTSKPTWQILTLQDLAIPLAEQKFEADRAHSHVIEVDASHAVTVSNPDVVADVIVQAARAAAK